MAINKKIVDPLSQEFISSEKNKHRHCLGHYLASSLSGFLAGIIVTSLVWLLILEAFYK